MTKRVAILQTDEAQYKLIKQQMGARTDTEVFRKLMQHYLMSEWIMNLFEEFKKELFVMLQPLYAPPEPFPRYLSL